MLRDDGVVGVELAGFVEQVVGAGGVAGLPCCCRELDEFGDTVFAGDQQGEGVVAVAGVELDGVGEAALGGGEVLVVELARAFEVGVVGLTGLFRGDGGLREAGLG